MLLPISTSFTQTSDSLASNYYKKGSIALARKDYDSAKSLFKKSLREKENAETEYQLAKVYRADTSHWSWNLSRQHIKKTIELDTKNPEYHLFYGLLAENLARNMHLEFETLNDAVKEYETTVKLDSTNVIAWERLAEIKAEYFHEFSHSGNMDFDASFYKNLAQTLGKYGFLTEYSYERLGKKKAEELYHLMANPVITFEPNSKEDFKISENAYLEAIKYNPSNPHNYLELSSLYEDNEMPQKGIGILKKLLEITPHNKDVHLNLGLLYYEASELDSSSMEYKKAIEEMSSDEKEDFLVNSVKILLKPILGDKLDKIGKRQLEEYIKLYWNFSDPLILTNYNERILEHYSRVAYANLRFSIPKHNIKGWQTDRGQIVIRYGIPKTRTILRADLGKGIKTHIWKYNKKTFAFISSRTIKNPLLAESGESKYWDDSEQLAKDFIKTDPSDYTPKFEGPTFTAPNASYQFKDLTRTKLTDLFISYAIKPETIPDNKKDIPYKYSSGIFFLDSYFNKLGEYKSDMDYLSRRNKISTPDSGSLFVNTDELVANPDSGNLAFEIIRDKDKGVAAYHGKFKLRNFNSSSPEVSNIVLASKVDADSGISGRINRKDYSVLPNPTGIFSENQNLYIYYEVYDLAKNEKGLTDFQQTIILKKKGEEGISIGKLVGSVMKFFNDSDNEQQIGLTSQYQTNDKNSQIYLQIDMSDYDPGNYLLTVKIKDNITGKEKEQSVNLYWE